MTVDRFGNPVAGAEVRWETSSGNGELSAETTVTGSDGTTSVIWTLGNRIGVQRATAKVEHADGSPGDLHGHGPVLIQPVVAATQHPLGGQ